MSQIVRTKAAKQGSFIDIQYGRLKHISTPAVARLYTINVFRHRNTSDDVTHQDYLENSISTNWDATILGGLAVSGILQKLQKKRVFTD